MENSIICGDCVEVMKTFPDNYIDLTVTSPPYDNLRTYKDNVGLKWNFETFKPIAKELYRITKDGGIVVWVVGDATIKGSETGTSFRQALFFKEIGFNLHDTMIYEKSGFSNPSTNRYHQIFEYMFVLSKGIPKTFNPIKDRKNIYSSGGGASYRKKDGTIVKTGRATKRNEYGMRFNIFRYPTGGGLMASDSFSGKHPAQFPEQLANDHIISWSNEGDIVLDPMCGSGTTCKMAKLNNRNYIGIDISEEYCNIARERIEKIS